MEQKTIFSPEGEVLTVHLSGELDHHAAASLRLQIDHSIRLLEPKLLILDFQEVGLMDSSGIGLILGRTRLMEERGGRVSLCGLSPRLSATLKLAGLSGLKTPEVRR